MGFGATARGAVTALNAHGVHDVRVLTTRGVAAVGSPIHSVRILQFDHDPEEPHMSQVITERGRVPVASFLAENDIVVNCTFQDTAAPLTYLTTEDLPAFRPGSLIVDVSCDEAMGFSWARPTTFDEPMFQVGNRIGYYAVDHSPSYLWNSATWENSQALIPFLRRSWRGRRRGTAMRPCVGRPRSVAVGWSTRTSSPSRGAQPSTRTWWAEPTLRPGPGTRPPRPPGRSPRRSERRCPGGRRGSGRTPLRPPCPGRRRSP